jgi:hypothetical protein
MKAIKEVFVFLNCFLCSIFNNTINLCFNLATNFQSCRVSFCVANAGNGKEVQLSRTLSPLQITLCPPSHLGTWLCEGGGHGSEAAVSGKLV